jgi:sugar lactone lactonase YvrE
MKLRPVLLCLAMSGLLACGDDLEPLPEPDDGGDETGDDDGVVERIDPCLDQSPGTACSWLGIPGHDGFTPDGADRFNMDVYWTMDMLFASDGTVWFDDWNNHLVRRVMQDGKVVTMVGWTDPIFPGDGVVGNPGAERTEQGAPGLDVRLNHPTDLVELPTGEVLIMAWHNHKLRTVDPETGMVRIICGAGAGFIGDNGPASGALFKQPSALAMDEDGNLYIGDQQNFRVRKIDTDSIITTIVGDGVQGYGGDGGPALEASLNWEAGSNPEPSGSLAVADGTLYIADTLNHRIRAVDLASGTIETLAGTGEAGPTGDDGPAVEATLNQPRGLDFGPDGDLYVADTNNHVIRAIDLETGVIRRVAGTGEPGFNEEGLPALETQLRRPFNVQFDPDGNLFILDTLNSRIVKVAR